MSDPTSPADNLKWAAMWPCVVISAAKPDLARKDGGANPGLSTPEQ